MTTQRRRIRLLVLVVFTLACVGIFLALLRIAGGLDLGAKYDFQAVVPNVVQLTTGADVREAGVNIGKVTGISNRGASAVIAMALDKQYGPVYRDGTVRVATKTLVGENYIDLNPGTKPSGAIPENGLLPISQAQDSVQLDTILSTFNPARRARLRRLIAGLGGGLSNSGPELNQTLDALASTVNQAGPVAQALSDQSQQLGSLVDNLGQVFTALGDRGAQIQRLAVAGLATANAVAGQDAALRQALRDLPSTLTTAQAVTAHLAGVGTAANPVLDDLGGALRALTPALRVLPTAGAATVAALQRLHSVTPRAEALVGALRRTAPVAAAVVPSLAGLVNQLRPMFAYLAPYATDAAHLLYILDDAGIGHDATGLLARIVGMAASTSLVTLTPGEQQLLKTLLGAGAAQLINFNGVNPYPAPGTATAPGQLSGTYPHVTADTGG